jgi:hypothetical protein
MKTPTNFVISYDRSQGVLCISLHASDSSFVVCPNDNRQIARAILANLTEQWNRTVLTNLGLSNLLGKNTEDVVIFLSNHLPSTLTFEFSSEELVNLLSSL